MADRVLPANHECFVADYNTAVGIWRCACGRAYRLVNGPRVRVPEMDDRPLDIDGTTDGD